MRQKTGEAWLCEWRGIAEEGAWLSLGKGVAVAGKGRGGRWEGMWRGVACRVDRLYSRLVVVVKFEIRKDVGKISIKMIN